MSRHVFTQSIGRKLFHGIIIILAFYNIFFNIKSKRFCLQWNKCD